VRGGEKIREEGEKVTSAVFLAASAGWIAGGIFWDREGLWIANRGGRED